MYHTSRNPTPRLSGIIRIYFYEVGRMALRLFYSTCCILYYIILYYIILYYIILYYIILYYIILYYICSPKETHFTPFCNRWEWAVALKPPTMLPVVDEPLALIAHQPYWADSRAGLNTVIHWKISVPEENRIIIFRPYSCACWGTNSQGVLVTLVAEQYYVVGPCHHGMARPQVADRGTASDKEGSCE